MISRGHSHKFRQANKRAQPFTLIAHNIRSLHNVGAIFRSADGAGVSSVILSGFTGTPPDTKIAKVALGSEDRVPWRKVSSLGPYLAKLKKSGVHIIALEQTKRSIDYRAFKPKFPMAIIVGNEIKGLSSSILTYADTMVHIPMHGSKESLNVSVAAGIICYHVSTYFYPL